MGTKGTSSSACSYQPNKPGGVMRIHLLVLLIDSIDSIAATGPGQTPWLCVLWHLNGWHTDHLGTDILVLMCMWESGWNQVCFKINSAALSVWSVIDPCCVSWALLHCSLLCDDDCVAFSLAGTDGINAGLQVADKLRCRAEALLRTQAPFHKRRCAEMFMLGARCYI